MIVTLWSSTLRPPLLELVFIRSQKMLTVSNIWPSLEDFYVLVSLQYLGYKGFCARDQRIKDWIEDQWNHMSRNFVLKVYVSYGAWSLYAWRGHKRGWWLFPIQPLLYTFRCLSASKVNLEGKSIFAHDRSTKDGIWYQFGPLKRELVWIKLQV